ncbi:glucose-1-phosphate thymidylyltransferase [Micromonospora sp. KC721]|uniref:glucose-1-phosphate thymidylyltransferase n=1 Tax=Micromonospora sp. KC721 TaxID=2530380 RepID=UPI001047C603|nr:glucose-1-phosphate thymidylyltransferase [Micromonospora sp. KC721]TDB80632.1 glucose-1-phosphate thymidylyltransferase [Micromonospora sp. KC721]
MKALVLSGGAGTRLRPFTYTTPKQLVPVANKPVLSHVLENIRDLGVREVGLVVGDRAAQIEQAIRDGSEFGLRVTYIPQQAPLGLAHAVLLAADFLRDDDFVMYLGDNVFAEGLRAAAASFHQRRPDAHLVVAKVSDPTSYGVAEVGPDGTVQAVVEKPAQPRSDLAVTGAYFFTPAIHQAVRMIEPSRRGELEITDAIQHLIATGHPVTVDRYDGYWKDTGQVEDLLECNRVLLDRLSPAVDGQVDDATRTHGCVVVQEGARVTNSHLIGPVIVGAGATVHNSRVGPYVAIGRECFIGDSTVQDSITLDGAAVRGVHQLRHSLIGRRAEVRADRRTAHRRLILGDDTQAEVPA